MDENTKKRVLQFFRDGQSVNHIVYLLDYEFHTDDVNRVIREYVRKTTELYLAASSIRATRRVLNLPPSYQEVERLIRAVENM